MSASDFASFTSYWHGSESQEKVVRAFEELPALFATLRMTFVREEVLSEGEASSLIKYHTKACWRRISKIENKIQREQYLRVLGCLYATTSLLTEAGLKRSTITNRFDGFTDMVNGKRFLDLEGNENKK